MSIYIIFWLAANISYRFLSSFVFGWSSRLWRWNMTFSDTEINELGRSTQNNIHNTWSLIRAIKYVADILQTEEAFTVEEYKHTHTHRHTHTHAHTQTHRHTDTHTHTHIHTHTHTHKYTHLRAQAVITWFKSIVSKRRSSFIRFYIVDFYPSISEELLARSTNYAKAIINTEEEVIKTVFHARKSLLFGITRVWVKKDNSDFDVTMGSYDGAEVCVVGLNSVETCYKLLCIS